MLDCKGHTVLPETGRIKFSDRANIKMCISMEKKDQKLPLESKAEEKQENTAFQTRANSLPTQQQFIHQIRLLFLHHFPRLSCRYFMNQEGWLW